MKEWAFSRQDEKRRQDRGVNRQEAGVGRWSPLLQGVEWSGEWGVGKQQDCGLPEGLVGTPLWVGSAKNDDPIHGKLARPRCPPLES